MRSPILISITLALGSSACAATGNPMEPTAAQLEEAARVMVRSAAIWGLLSHQSATPQIRSVDGLAHHQPDPRLVLDDRVDLAPGPHDIGVVLVGSPSGHGLAQTSAQGCLQVQVAARTRYVLRGVIDDQSFQLKFFRQAEGREEQLASVPLTLTAGGRAGPPLPCPPGLPPQAGASASGA
jgi:hypothetical protein